MPILDKIKLRRIKISLESWENVCESIESTIQDGQKTYRKRCFAPENLLSLLKFPIMDSIENSMPPKSMIEQVEGGYLKSKERIEQLDHIHIAEIKYLIHSPIDSEMKINLCLCEWEKVKKRDIASLTRKAQLQLQHAQYHDVEYLLDVFSKWKYTLGKY